MKVIICVLAENGVDTLGWYSASVSDSVPREHLGSALGDAVAARGSIETPNGTAQCRFWLDECGTELDDLHPGTNQYESEVQSLDEITVSEVPSKVLDAFDGDTCSN